MKRIIIIVWVLSLTLTIFAQGNKNLRDHQMPARIENLFRYAESLGYKRGEYYYNLHGILTKRVSLSPTLRFGEKRTLLLDSIRHTFAGLINDGVVESYRYETHHDSIDSMSYRIQLDNGKKIKRMLMNPLTGKPYSTTTTEYKMSFLNFRYTPTPWDRGTAVLIYQYTDSVLEKSLEPLNKKEYWKIVKRTIKRNHVKGHSYYLYNDSTLHNHNPDVADGALYPHCRIIEQKGFVYEIDTKEHLEEIMRDLVQETWDYLDKYPDVRYSIYPETLNPGLNRDFISIRTGDSYYSEFIVFVMHFRNPEHFWLVVRETEGDDFLPMDWERLKSYKNGVKVYHKK